MEEEEEKGENGMIQIGALASQVQLVEDACEETMVLWGLEQPTLAAPNAFVCQTSMVLQLDACGHNLWIQQAPASMNKPGVTGAVMWDSGVVLAKFLEHAVESGLLHIQGKRCVELGAGCGLVGCVAALLGGHVVLTDLHDRLRLLQKNVDENVKSSRRGSACVQLLEWGAELEADVFHPPPDYVLASDVIYNEDVVPDLLHTLRALSRDTTIFIAGELRNDAVLECFFTQALKHFVIGRVPKRLWHPDFKSPRVALYVLVGRSAGNCKM